MYMQLIKRMIRHLLLITSSHLSPYSNPSSRITIFFCCFFSCFSWFLVTLFSALFASMLLFLYCLAFFVLYFADRESIVFNCPHPMNLTACDPVLRVLGGPIPDVVFPIFLAVLGVLALIAIGLIGHLTGYHVYLSKSRVLSLSLSLSLFHLLLLPLLYQHVVVKGISTYEHIRRQREVEQLASVDRTYQRQRSFREFCCAFRNIQRKTSRVTPLSDEESSAGSSPSPQPPGGRRRRSRSNSGGSLGMANFGRTPPLVSWKSLYLLLTKLIC